MNKNLKKYLAMLICVGMLLESRDMTSIAAEVTETPEVYSKLTDYYTKIC
ncbi:hypothetical protein [Pseudobutyrivibrio xylanivorans]|nr:hypothetical protein [Pseudobutyrivibrio xylanivorans]